MTRFLVFVLLMAITALGTELTSPPADQTPQITFNKNVLPVLQKNCQVCHRPGGVAPMSFMTFESTRPWAKAIKAAVINKKMPPWFADPHVGEFRNAPKLTPDDVNTLAGWADRGASEGNPADKPTAASGHRVGESSRTLLSPCPSLIGLQRRAQERSRNSLFRTPSRKIHGYRLLRFVRAIPPSCTTLLSRFRRIPWP